VAVLHAPETSAAAADSPSGGLSSPTPTIPEEPPRRGVESTAGNVVQVNFGQRRVA